MEEAFEGRVRGVVGLQNGENSKNSAGHLKYLNGELFGECIVKASFLCFLLFSLFEVFLDLILTIISNTIQS